MLNVELKQTFTLNGISCNAIDLSFDGRCVLLAGRRLVAAVDLSQVEVQDEALTAQNVLSYQRKGGLFDADVSLVACSPWRQEALVASGRDLELYTFDQAGIRLLHTVDYHTRAISALSYQAHSGHLVASCSNDSLTAIWDMRTFKQPVQQLKFFSSVSQVRFQPGVSTLLATAIESDIRLWDLRHLDQPVLVRSKPAHTSRILAMNWCPTKPSVLATGTQDGAVRLWTADKDIESISGGLNLSGPVKKVQFDPDREIIATLVVPSIGKSMEFPGAQLWRYTAGESVLLRSDDTDVTQDICWMWHSDGDASLLSWSREQRLRLWAVRQMEARSSRHIFDREDSIASSRFTVTSTPTEPDIAEESNTLEGEKEKALRALPKMIERSFPHLSLTMNLRQQSLAVTARERILCSMTIQWDRGYPDWLPHFHIDKVEDPSSDAAPEKRSTARLHDEIRTHLEETWRELGEERQLLPLADFLRQLVIKFSEAVSRASSGSRDGTPLMERQISVDASIDAAPRGRTIGVSFSGDVLVAFMYTARVPTQPELNTRLSTKGHRTSVPGPTRMRSVRSTKPLEQRVVMYDVGSLQTVSRRLAAEYCSLRYADCPQTVCESFAVTASRNNRSELARAWSLLAVCLAPELVLVDMRSSVPPWSSLPLGRELVRRLLQHFCTHSDVQTAALMAALLAARDKPIPSPPENLDDGAYFTIGTGQQSMLPRLRRTNSHAGVFPVFESEEMELLIHNQEMLLVGEGERRRLDELRWSYANVLHQWGLLSKRAELLKGLYFPPTSPGARFMHTCPQCGKSTESDQCPQCHRLLLRCCICHMRVQGLFTVCDKCGHAGHLIHLRQWFLQHTLCPTGCGCDCVRMGRMDRDSVSSSADRMV